MKILGKELKFNNHKIYHAGDKPTASEIGALASNGTAVAASKLATARTINGVNFDGTANITIPIASHNHDSSYLKLSGGTITDAFILRSAGTFQDGFTIPTKGNDRRGVIFNIYGEGTSSYLEIARRNAENTDWHWGSSTKMWADGRLEVNTFESRNWIMLANNKSLYGKKTDGGNYTIAFLGNNNEIGIGHANETYINIWNTTRVHRDIHMQTGSVLYAKNIRINSEGQWTSIGLGPTNVRLEYNKGDAVYIAGSETVSSGYGTPFRAKHFDNVEQWIKIGGKWLTISSSAPNASTGDVWIQI